MNSRRHLRMIQSERLAHAQALQIIAEAKSASEEAAAVAQQIRTLIPEIKSFTDALRTRVETQKVNRSDT